MKFKYSRKPTSEY